MALWLRLSLVKSTPTKAQPKRRLVKKFFRFALIGVLNTVIHAGALATLVQIGNWSSGAGNVGAYLFASTLSFFLNARFAFRVKRSSIRFLRFQMVGLINIAVCYGLGVLADAEGIHYLWLVLMTGLILPLISFVLHCRFSFA